MKKEKGTIGQFLMFAGVGAIGTVGHYTTLIVLVQFWKVDPVFASSFGFVVGAVINYILNYHFTFQSEAAYGSAGEVPDRRHHRRRHQRRNHVLRC